MPNTSNVNIDTAILIVIFLSFTFLISSTST